jgi:c-di-GMP-binding flagellar brake protein YcgR
MWPLLQSLENRSNSPLVLPVLIGLVVIIVISSLIRAARKGGGKAQAGGGASVSGRASQSGGKKLSSWQFRRFARNYGLDADQTEFLEHYARSYGVSDAGFLFQNTKALDKLLKKAYDEIEGSSDSEEIIEGRKRIVFGIRERMELVKSQGKVVRSTRELSDGQAIGLLSEDNENYPSRVVAVGPSGIIATVPTDALGTEMRFKKGSKAKVVFYAKNGQGYSFMTKVMGYEARRSGSVMQISHSDHVQMLPSRKHKRRELNSSCYFYYVSVETVREGRKERKKAVVDKRRIMGTIIDISAGGCSIKTANPLSQGEYLKIEFDTNRGTANVLGKVVRVNKGGGIGGIMHVQFARSSLKTLNDIRSYVYGYAEG